MSEQSAIEWTDATWNPVRGCMKVSPGCAHCYAETFAERFRGVNGHPYEQGFDLRLVPEKLTEPLSWKKPRRVFVNSMSDLFQDGVPDSYIDRVFAVMALAPQHTFQVLTKRAERMHAYLSDPGFGLRLGGELMGAARGHAGAERIVLEITHRLTVQRQPLPNVWLGVSVENQHFADERIPLLLQTPAVVRFISAEPLLEAMDLRAFVACDHNGTCGNGHDCAASRCGRLLDWVIVGGESGPGARRFNVAWARSIVAQCQAAGVPCFVKQLGGNPHSNTVAGYDSMFKLHLMSTKGGDPSEWPVDLRVREFPATREAVP